MSKKNNNITKDNNKEEVKKEQSKEIKNTKNNNVENSSKNKGSKDTNTKKTKNVSKVNDNEVKKSNKSVNDKISKNTAKDKEELKTTDKVNSKNIKVKKVSDNAIIGIIVAIIIITAGVLFGFYFYNTNYITVATYDGGKITSSEFKVYYQTFSPMLTYYGYPESYIPEVIANKAAIDEILLAKAKEENISLTDDEKKEIDDEFTEEQIEYLEEQEMDINKTKQLYYNDKLISKYMEKMANDLSDDEVLEYIKSSADGEVNLTAYNTSHILFKTVDSSYATLSDEEIEKQRQKAEEVLARALAGEDFSALVKEFSEDTGTKDDNGNYTVYMDGNTDTEYANAATSLKVGEITPQLVKSSYGYHIIKLNSIDENGRLKNMTDRESLVDEKVNNLATDKNFKVIEDKMKKVVEQITGKSSTSDSDVSVDTDSTDSTDSIDTDETQQPTNETEGE